jgi:hypothetical protein
MSTIEPTRTRAAGRGPSRRSAARGGKYGAAAALRREGFDLRKIAIVANDYPTREAAGRLEEWRAIAPAWVTVGCLNAIGAGLESLGLSRGGLRRCRSALRSNGILVVVQGTPEEASRARRACRRK